MLCCQLCSTHYAAFQIKNCSKAPLKSTHTKRKKWCRAPRYRLKSEVPITIHCWLCSTRYTAVPIKNCLKSTSAIKIVTTKNTDDFHYKEKPSRAAIAKLTPCVVSKDEWDTKEDNGKSMKNAWYTLRHAKRHISSQSNVEQ